MDAVKKRAQVIESAQGDSIAIRPVGILAHSFDHRAIDGAYSAAYMQALKSIIEDGFPVVLHADHGPTALSTSFQ